MLKVVTDACKFSNDGGSGIVVIESRQEVVNTKNYSADIEALSGVEARNLAIKYSASIGCPDPRINGNVGTVYPVNKEGTSLDAVRSADNQELPNSHELMQIDAYRVDIPITKRLL